MSDGDYFAEVGQIWRLAYVAGVAARERGLGRICDLVGSPFCAPSGIVLKVYYSAWEQGWDGFVIPAVFGRMEAFLRELPTRPCSDEDFGL